MTKYPLPSEPLTPQPCWCGSTDSRTVSNHDRWRQPLKTAICLQCGTVRQEPRMTKRQAAQFYRDDYEKTHEPSEFFQRQQLLSTHRYLRSALDGVATVLDYGCGPGGKLAALVNEGVDVYGFDLNPHFLAFAEGKGLKRWDPERQYDCLFLSHTLEHWIQPREDLSHLLTCNLKPGGLVIIEVPLVDRLVLGLRRGGFSEETHLAHVWYFSTATLSALLATMSCELQFSDKVTTCIFRHRASGTAPKSLSSPTNERIRLALIELNRNPLLARVARRLNRSLQFVDTDFRQRMIAKDSDAELT